MVVVVVDRQRILEQGTWLSPVARNAHARDAEEGVGTQASEVVQAQLKHGDRRNGSSGFRAFVLRMLLQSLELWNLWGPILKQERSI